MRFIGVVLPFLSAAPLISAAPVRNHASDIDQELPDGLPYPSPSELALVEQHAHGTLPNTSPPPVISNKGIVNLQLIAFNELFEVAFFNELVTNITENVGGYRFSDPDDKSLVLASLEAILAQEELHAIRANNALSHFHVNPIEPCQYLFPVKDFDSAIALASKFTDVVLGTLQDTIERFSLGNDYDLAREIGAVIANKGEQQGWFRMQQGKIPSELPFLTTSDLNFDFTAIQNFVYPGSCPNINEIPLRTFEPLDILTTPSPKSQNVTFSFQDWTNETSKLWMTYINQQNLPIVEHLDIISHNGNTIVASALFPYDDHELNGLTISAVTKKEGPFGDANEVSKWTLAGPGLIIVN